MKTNVIGIIEKDTVGVIVKEKVATLVGFQGDPGPEGIGFFWRGTYEPTSSYIKGDAVGFSGMVYICDVACTGVSPDETTNWSLLLGNTIERIDAGSWD